MNVYNIKFKKQIYGYFLIYQIVATGIATGRRTEKENGF